MATTERRDTTVTRWEDDFHTRNDQAAKQILKFLKMNGHKLDGPNDGTVIRNTIYEFFYGPARRLIGHLSDVDFHLDEFGLGVCAVPPKRGAKISQVPDAVNRAISTYIGLLGAVRMQHKQLREALTALKVEHMNKRIKLPVKFHALVENVLADTADSKKFKAKNYRKQRKLLGGAG